MDISLNSRIYKDIKNKIKDKIYLEGDLLPTESQLMLEYGVSRAPVRQALGRLENDGVIIRKAGKGTYVAKNESWSTAKLGGFRSEFLKNGEKVTCQTVVVKEIKPDIKTKLILGTLKDEKIIYVERIRSLSGRPFQYLVHFLKDMKLSTVLNARDIADMPSFLAEHSHELYSVQEVIESVLLPEEIASKLNLPVSTPALRIERKAFDK